jgi:DNA processing protein
VVIETVHLTSPRYPDRLRRIYDPPPLIYVRGDLRSAEPAVAVVGSRRATATGRVVTERLAAGLAASGVTVVSGLARGIDAVAHRAALDAGGRTIAVLGCGLDVIYPPEHAGLMEAITQQGCIITEFPLGTPPLRHHFPQRNRIIAGLTLGVVVVEGDERSGALSTAGYALDEGREVMAVPGVVRAMRWTGTRASRAVSRNTPDPRADGVTVDTGCLVGLQFHDQPVVLRRTVVSEKLRRLALVGDEQIEVPVIVIVEVGDTAAVARSG